MLVTQSVWLGWAKNLSTPARQDYEVLALQGNGQSNFMLRSFFKKLRPSLHIIGTIMMNYYCSKEKVDMSVRKSEEVGMDASEVRNRHRHLDVYMEPSGRHRA